MSIQEANNTPPSLSVSVGIYGRPNYMAWRMSGQFLSPAVHDPREPGARFMVSAEAPYPRQGMRDRLALPGCAIRLTTGKGIF